MKTAAKIRTSFGRERIERKVKIPGQRISQDSIRGRAGEAEPMATRK
jgi:hypothetical protein